MFVVVLGGSGFLGSHLVDRLVADGHRVRVVSRSPERFRGDLDGVDYVRGDFTHASVLEDALDGVEAVCHFATTTVPSSSNRDPVFDVATNLVGTVQLLEAMRERGIRRILYMSSGGTVYGEPVSFPVPESAGLHPISSYGVVKVAVENYLHMYEQLYGLEPVIIRASNPYGPRQPTDGSQGLIAVALAHVGSRKPITVWGDGTNERDYVFVSEVAAGCALALGSGLTGVYNLGSGIGTSVNEILSLIEAVTGTALEVLREPSRGFDVRRLVLDVSKAESDLGWKPSIPLAEGIERHWAWLSQVG